MQRLWTKAAHPHERLITFCPLTVSLVAHTVLPYFNSRSRVRARTAIASAASLILPCLLATACNWKELSLSFQLIVNRAPAGFTILTRKPASLSSLCMITTVPGYKTPPLRLEGVHYI
ncbi:Uncharacterized protein HZ326_22387 [Fusarium oxysporum f. sp. albedinis]|nr:Uncharacterized protein HZ326_22387 [Fusarium oxysporum f. sp. albedinis]